MAFFEDIAFFVNSDLLRIEVAYYMFGWDALEAWNSDEFWSDTYRHHESWRLLKHFVDQMEELKISPRFDPSSIRL